MLSNVSVLLNFELLGRADDLFSPEGDNILENEGTPFSKSGGLFSGTGTLFDEVPEDEGESPRTNDLEASVRSNRSCESS